LPPLFNDTQCLSDNEIVDILLFGTPKSWQREMDRQGFDPLARPPSEVVQFMERIKMLEDFDVDKKTTNVAKNNNNKGKKKSNFNKGNSDADGSKYCMLHGNNNTHDTSECKTLMAQAKKLKGNNAKPKGGNKTWKNKSKDDTDDSKKELVALVKKATEVLKKSELNAIEPVKKRKVNWPSKEEQQKELCELDSELHEFNYNDMEKLVIKDPNDGEVDEASISTKVSV